MMGETQARSTLSAEFKGCKQWYWDEERLLLKLHQQNFKVNWVKMQSIFNCNLQSSRHWTADALTCKYKVIKHITVGEQPQTIPFSQGPERSHQHSQLVNTISENVRTFLHLCSFLLTCKWCSLWVQISLWRVWESPSQKTRVLTECLTEMVPLIQMVILSNGWRLRNMRQWVSERQRRQ